MMDPMDPNFGRSRKVVELKTIDDRDVIQMMLYRSNDKKEPSQGKRGRKSRKNEEDHDGHEEVLDLLNVQLPEECIEPTANMLSEELLNVNEDGHIGFHTPNKRQAMTQKAQESANKYYGTPNKHETPIKSRSTKTADQHTPTKTPKSRSLGMSARRSSITFGGELGRTPTKGLTTPTKSALKTSRRSELDEPRTPKSKRSPLNGESSAIRSMRRTIKDTLTPSRRVPMSPIRESTALIPKTPHRDRLRNKAIISNAIQSMGDDSDSEDCFQEFSSDDEDDFKPEDEGSSEEEEEESESDGNEKSEDDSDDEKLATLARKRGVALVVKTDPAAAAGTPSRRRRGQVNYEFATDAYFETMASKDITSNNTLSRLRNPRLREDAMRDLLKDGDVAHKEPLHKLTEEHHALFNRWLFALREGFNILLYGFGSKRHLLQSFHDEMLGDSTVLVVNGFFPGLTLKEMLDTMLTDLLGVAAKDTPSNPLEAVDAIAKIQSSPDAATLYLLIHNLDGPSLKNNKAQTVLSQLARVPNVRLIASVDHINASLMWDQTKLCRYKFSWWDVTTFLPYSVETSFETSLLVQRSGALQLSALHNVFKSLSDNSKKIYMMIAKHALENASNDAYTGLPIQDLYWMAREGFVVSSQPILRQMLREFEDHDMIKMKKGYSEAITIPIQKELVQQFVQAQQEKAD